MSESIAARSVHEEVERARATFHHLEDRQLTLEDH
jgi:hypothetical protein